MVFCRPFYGAGVLVPASHSWHLIPQNNPESGTGNGPLFFFQLIILLFLMHKMKRLWATAAVMALGTGAAFAQSGVTGLNPATSTLKTYVDPASNIALVIGGIVG